MRKAFANSLIKLAEKDEDIMLLAGDLGFNFFETFARKFPKQFINCGVIEQSMIGIAAGLALAGKKPYVYSASTFLLFRALEQIRNDICYQNLNVKLIGFAGLSYNFLGYTHQPQDEEDVRILELFPNIKIYEPQNPEEMQEVISKVYKNKSPSYIKIDKPKREQRTKKQREYWYDAYNY